MAEFLKAQARRIGPLGSIILLHLLFFYALQSGLLHKAVEAMPNEVFATLITPQAPKPETPNPQVEPKTVPVVKKSAPKPMTTPAPAPVVPSERAIAVAPPPSEPAAAAPAAPAPPAPPKTISGVEYLQAPQPDYPGTSRRLREEGKVLLRVLIDERGRPEKVDIQKSSGFPRLDEAARQAALRALFKPYAEDGKALAVFAVIPINFQLDN